MENMNYNTHQGATSAPLLQQPAAQQETKAVESAKFDFKDFLMELLMHWYWFALCGLIAFIASFIYVRTLQPKYQRVSDIQIKSVRDDGLDMRSALGITSNSSSNNIQNELYIIRSLKLAREVANKLHLDVQYYKEGTFRKVYLFNERPFTVTFHNDYLHDLLIAIKPISAQTFTISRVFVNDEEKVLPSDNTIYFFGTGIKIPVSEEELTVTVNDGNYPYLVSNLEEDIFVSRTSPESAAYFCQSMIEAESRASSMVRIICTARSVSEADAILSGVFDVYNQQSLDEKNQQTISSVEFVEARISETARELGENANKLSSSGVAKSARNTDATVAASMAAERSDAANLVSSTQNSIEQARTMRNRVQSAIASKDVIPTLPGISEAGISGQVLAYNNLIQQRNRLVNNSSVNHPAVKKIDVTLEEQESMLVGAIDAYIDELQANNKLASGRLARAAAYSSANQMRFDSTDIEAQSLLISQDYKQEYFSFLLKRREELRLDLATSSADTKVVEDPMGNTTPIYPIPKEIYMKFTLVGLAIPAIILLLMTLLTTTIRGRKDVEDVLSMPFLGEVPEYDESRKSIDKNKKNKKNKKSLQRKSSARGKSGSKIVINNNTKSIVSEAFRIVQSNLSFFKVDDKGNLPQTIMLTSFAPGAGKSFVSVNLASCLAHSEDKRSIWIDLDLRKGHKNDKLLRPDLIPSKNIGLSSYLAGKAELDECIIESAHNDRLDIMVAGPIPPNPVQLFMSEKFDEMIAELRTRYEYIILDSVPATVVADASICNRVADITIYVLRVGVTDRRVLPQVEKLYQQHKFKNLCTLLNGASIVKRSGYGYGYGYGYGFGYGYGYGYGETDESKN